MLQLPAGREASRGERALRYERHRPEQTLLYQLVEEYYPAFEAQWAAAGRVLPDYVRQEFDEYLKCGRLEQTVFTWMVPTDQPGFGVLRRRPVQSSPNWPIGSHTAWVVSSNGKDSWSGMRKMAIWPRMR